MRTCGWNTPPPLSCVRIPLFKMVGSAPESAMVVCFLSPMIWHANFRWRNADVVQAMVFFYCWVPIIFLFVSFIYQVVVFLFWIVLHWSLTNPMCCMDGDIPLVRQPLFRQQFTLTAIYSDSPLFRQAITPTAHYSRQPVLVRCLLMSWSPFFHFDFLVSRFRVSGEWGFTTIKYIHEYIGVG